MRRAPVAAGRGDRDLGQRAVRLRARCPTPFPPAARSCRRSATPTPPSWCAAKTGRIIGALTGLLMVMKGLPLAYAKDMQDDKEPVFEAFDTLAALPRRDAGHGRDRDVRHGRGCGRRPRRASPPRPTSPTGWCASRACRSARRITSPAPRQGGRSARLCARRRCRWRRCRRSSRAITRGVFDVLGVEASVASRTSQGGTAPARVRAAVAAARRRFLGSAAIEVDAFL